MELKSARFREERVASWRELEGLVVKAEKQGIRSLSAAELLRLPRLYRAVLSSLSVSRSISLDRNLASYLETLASRAYFFVYGTRTNLGAALAAFFTDRWPAAVRSAGKPFVIAVLAMALGWGAGHILTTNNPEWFYTLVSDPVETRTPTATYEHLENTLFSHDDAEDQGLGVFSSFLFTHNSRVAMFAFALGFVLGIPTVLLLFYNGAMIGSMGAVFVAKGLGPEFYGWISIHGTTELLAILLCGAAGLMIGGAVAFPGPHSRLTMMAQVGKRASLIVLGGVVMLFVAGLLEGYGRQLIDDTATRYAIGAVMLALWTTYFLTAGRRAKAPVPNIGKGA